MKKINAFILILLSALMLIVPTGCSNGAVDFDRENAVKVTFELEGGTYQNSPAAIVYYYNFKNGTKNLIKNPAAENKDERFSKSTVTRTEYVLDGWYQTRTEVEGSSPIYSEPWDFKNDRIEAKSGATLTLYAKWSRLIHYTYQIYREITLDDGTVELDPIGIPYDVQEGDKFRDILGFATNVSGYTFDGFFTETGEPWDDEFTHPGGEEDTEIKVIVKLIEGEFVDVHTAAELKAAGRSDIRLMADIDLGGEVFAGFVNYNKIFEGNGHTVSNFKLKIDDSRDSLDLDEALGGTGSGRGTVLNASLFGKANKARVSNVTFADFTIDINTNNSQINVINIAPLCVKATNSTFSNVTVSGVTYMVTRLPDDLDTSAINAETENGYIVKDDKSVFEQISITVNNQIA